MHLRNMKSHKNISVEKNIQGKKARVKISRFSKAEVISLLHKNTYHLLENINDQNST